MSTLYHIPMSDMGGLESFAPGEGQGVTPEALSEEAKQRFAAAGAALQNIAKEEKKAKRKDTGIADAILHFLNDDQKTHFSVLISRMAARNCPSIFLLSLLSLINDNCLRATLEYLQEKEEETEAAEEIAKGTQLLAPGTLSAKSNQSLVEWMTRLQVILAYEHTGILKAIQLDDSSLDTTLLQLTTFIMQDFFEAMQKPIDYDTASPLCANLLQILFEPYLKQEQLEEGKEDVSS